MRKQLHSPIASHSYSSRLVIDSILKLRKFDEKTVGEYRNTAQEFARRGFRSLGVAIKEEGRDWVLLGIMSMSDPPRSDTAAVSF
jgi:H+-transporting ATPase